MIEIFVTATDTDAGKTYVATALVHALVTDGKRVAVYKPISAGCQQVGAVLVNEDAQLLQIAANCQQSITDINPIAFEPAIAPHIAAQQCNKTIYIEEISQHYQTIKALKADIVVTEGAGGWRLPLGNGHFLSDFVKQSNQKVLLVVNMKLGCLNHAVLTYQSIISDGLECIGWVANCAESMPYLAENITELENLLPIPKLASFSFEKDIKIAAQQFNVSALLT
ncbi:MAG: dethiobiotin synthetase [Alteromonadaceae bacterium]|jgi:dethiobiotin synthetase